MHFQWRNAQQNVRSVAFNKKRSLSFMGLRSSTQGSGSDVMLHFTQKLCADSQGSIRVSCLRLRGIPSYGLIVAGTLAFGVAHLRAIVFNTSLSVLRSQKLGDWASEGTPENEGCSI